MNLPRPLHLPPLPGQTASGEWPVSIARAYEVMEEAYDRASQLLRLEDGDPIRLRIHVERISLRIHPILEALGNTLKHPEWTAACEEAFKALVEELNLAATQADQV